MQLKLTDLINIEKLQGLLDHLYEATGIPSGIIGHDGEIITATGWRDICTKFHRVNELTQISCVESDTSIREKIEQGDRYAISKCKNGLVDIGTPIMVNNQHIATMFQGQFFFEEPDLTFFEEQAKRVGFDRKSYLKAIKETPIIPEEQIMPVVEFLSDFADFIANIGYANLQTQKSYEELHHQHEEMTGLYEELVATEEELRDNYQKIREQNIMLETMRQRYELIVEGSKDIIFDYDYINKDLFVADGSSRLFGSDKTNVSIDDIIKYIDDDTMSKLSNILMSSDQKSNAISLDFSFINDVNMKRWVILKGKILRNSAKDIIRIAGVISDNTAFMKRQIAIEKMAYTDTLTGLGNRASCLKSIKDLIDQPDKVFHVLFLDLDNFKHINDVYGHPIGDHVLSVIGKRLSTLEDENTQVHRFGGDEFIISSTHDKIDNFIDEVIHLVNLPLIIEDKNFKMTASIGHVSYPKDAESTNDLLKYADAAMYQAKQAGKNTVHAFNNSIKHRNKHARLIEESILLSLDNDDFYLVYQPKVNNADGSITGYEALIRWEHPELGFIPPDQFIHIAEERNLIKEVDFWVVESVFKFCKNYPQLLVDKHISINLSVDTIIHPSLTETIEKLMEIYRISSKNITFEITENSFFKSFTKAHKAMSSLKHLGFSIAIDDFGKGFSSLQYLQKFPVDELKIDKSFIDQVADNNKEIIRFIIQLGHELDMTVTAEGVEEAHQYNILRKLDCDLTQGYYFYRPMKEKELLTL